MNQYPSHSNTPSFEKKSATSQILYQHPTKEEQTSKSATLSNIFFLVMIFALIALVAYVFLITADNEAKARELAQVQKELVK